jgi:hypothetical protein
MEPVLESLLYLAIAITIFRIAMDVISPKDWTYRLLPCLLLQLNGAILTSMGMVQSIVLPSCSKIQCLLLNMRISTATGM